MTKHFSYKPRPLLGHEFNVRVGCPISEVSEEFLQGMADRMAMSYYRYGAIEIAYPMHVDAIDSLLTRLRKYRAEGNREWLIDVANYAMIEYMRPAHPRAHYKPTDSDQSPGRAVTHGRPDDTNADLTKQ